MRTAVVILVGWPAKAAPIDVLEKSREAVMIQNSVYHEGELQVQQRAGEAMQARRSGGVVSDSIPIGALPFIGQQSLAAAASIDPQGNVWASILIGRPGFLSAPDQATLEVDLGCNPLSLDDPLWKNIQQDKRLGFLVIDLATRRRLRVNGAAWRLQGRLSIEVAEAYPNCPKYIQRRHPVLGEGRPQSQHEVQRGRSLTLRQMAMIGAADTFFVASHHPRRGLDASHRGGMPGFVHILEDQTLLIPDYPGNSMFNTLGNFAVNPQAGLAFVDFVRGVLLQLSGPAEILWDQDSKGADRGTGRAWQLSVRRWVETRLPRSIDWEFLDYSPFNPEVN